MGFISWAGDRAASCHPSLQANSFKDQKQVWAKQGITRPKQTSALPLTLKDATSSGDPGKDQKATIQP